MFTRLNVARDCRPTCGAAYDCNGCAGGAIYKCVPAGVPTGVWNSHAATGVAGTEFGPAEAWPEHPRDVEADGVADGLALSALSGIVEIDVAAHVKGCGLALTRLPSPSSLDAAALAKESFSEKAADAGAEASGEGTGVSCGVEGRSINVFRTTTILPGLPRESRQLWLWGSEQPRAKLP